VLGVERDYTLLGLRDLFQHFSVTIDWPESFTLTPKRESIELALLLHVTPGVP
jgi:hypothetical protein